MTYGNLRTFIVLLVFGTALAIGAIAKADHETMSEMGDNTDNLMFNVGLGTCTTLADIKKAVMGNPAPTCGLTSMVMQGDVILVDREERNEKIYTYAQVTFTGQSPSPSVVIPMPPTVMFILWNVQEGGSDGA